jgi:hypothetical protein
MKLAVMQPYFFPYLGQFDLLNGVDTWIAYDPAQYIRHGWVNRNRVLHAVKGWQYITVPVRKHPHTAPINLIETAGDAWKACLLKQLRDYRADAPFYRQVIDFLDGVLGTEETNLARLNAELFRATAAFLGIRTPILLFSDMGLALEPVNGPENLALAVCRAASATEYVNPPGGAGLYSPERFAGNGVKLTIQSPCDFIYQCGRFLFVPRLSILDVMMWNSSEQIKNYLDTFRPAKQETGKGTAGSS